MVRYKIFCCFLSLILCKYGFAIDENVKINDDFSLNFSNGGVQMDLVLNRGANSEVVANLAYEMNKKYNHIERNENGIQIEYPNKILFDIRSVQSPLGIITLKIRTFGPKYEPIKSCFNLSNHHWYGGPQQKHQYWPIEKLVLSNYSYVPKEADNAAIIEPYWLSSSGLFIYVDKEVPLFVDQNSEKNQSLCIISQVAEPYSSKRENNVLSYNLGIFNDPKESHRMAVKTFLGKPTGLPDYRMVERPIWSTWAKFKTLINESIVVDFANKILEYGFNNSQYEIDDLWETCYGSFNVDTKKFPDMRRLHLNLKALGFRITYWIHPFINIDCEPWFSEALNKGYLVKNEKGDVKTSWWNSKKFEAAYVDFTNEEAANWWVNRLERLKSTYEIDSFKFDAGETSWSPQIPIQTGDVYTQPSHITDKYVRSCAKFGPLVEVRAGQRTQDLPIFVRMIDKDSEWNFENGLPTLITTLLQMNMNGYPLVLPDMIGGNGYNGTPSKELFIRWLQANVFMPSMQYSYVPWDYDNETVAISLIYNKLHEKYAGKIYDAMRNAVQNGDPVNPPIWWIDPTDQTALGIWDEFLLGEDILVAPVIEQGATKRDIYLPEGNWLAEGQENKLYSGKQWIRNYSAPLNALPYFVKTS